MSAFFETINAAVRDIEEHGFDSQQRIDGWMEKIEKAARASMISEAMVHNVLSASLGAIYTRLVIRGGALKYHPGVSRFKLSMVAPRLRNELDRRIMASAQLIKLNREQSIAKTLQRFSGWATSIPAGGSNVVNTAETKQDIKKSLKSLTYEERRVAIDQGHKLASSINDILAVDGGAIAAEWHSHYRQPGYDYRVDHRERDSKIYLIRGNWAQEKGFVKPGEAGYTDQITMPGEEIFCKCSYRYLYSLSLLPDDMLTEKGRSALTAHVVAA